MVVGIAVLLFYVSILKFWLRFSPHQSIDYSLQLPVKKRYPNFRFTNHLTLKFKKQKKQNRIYGINWIIPLAQIYLSSSPGHNTFIHFLSFVVDCETLAESEHNISLNVPSAWLGLVGAEMWTKYITSRWFNLIIVGFNVQMQDICGFALVCSPGPSGPISQKEKTPARRGRFSLEPKCRCYFGFRPISKDLIGTF